MLFEKLPEVETCCCGCSLRAGTILIAIFGIFGSLLVGCLGVVGISEDYCFEGVIKKDCPVGFKQHLMNVKLVTDFAVFLPSIFLLLAVLIKNRKLVTIYLYFIVFSQVTSMITRIILYCLSASGNDCAISEISLSVCVTNHIIELCIFAYFIIVVKSFRSTIVTVPCTPKALRDAKRRSSPRGKRTGGEETTASTSKNNPVSTSRGLTSNKEEDLPRETIS